MDSANPAKKQKAPRALQRIQAIRMGFVHALEVLHALVHVYQQKDHLALSKETLDELPYPHLQQRLQQTIRGVLLVASLGVTLPIVVLCFLPMIGSRYAFPGLASFVFLALVLLGASLAQILVRYVMMPAPRPFLTDRASIYGVVQTILCVAFDAVARIYQEPQLLVLLTLCVFNSWLWKSCFYAITTSVSSGDDTVREYFSTFVLVGGLVSFLSFIALEKSIGEDPFVLDPRAALQTGLQRDFVRAVRRAVIVWSATRIVLFLAAPNESLFSLRFARAYFHLTSSAVENFVWLSTASVFRILLFRASHKALASASADGSLWDSLQKTSQHDEVSIEDLFAGALPVDSQASIPLNEQYVVALRNRVDSALQQISSRKRVCGSSVGFENVEALDTLFKYSNLMLVSKFNRSSRKAVFSSEQRWNALFQSTTAVIDSFTLSLQLLNTIPERKNQGEEKLVNSLETSLPNLLKFVLSKANTNPLLLLDEHPHLSNLRISPARFKSTIQYYFDSRAQFAVRRFLIEESRRRVFLRSKVWCEPIHRLFPMIMSSCLGGDVSSFHWLGRVHFPRALMPLGEHFSRRRFPRNRAGASIFSYPFHSMACFAVVVAGNVFLT